MIKEKLEKEVALVDKVERNLSLDLIVEISSSLNDSVIPARCRYRVWWLSMGIGLDSS